MGLKKTTDKTVIRISNIRFKKKHKHIHVCKTHETLKYYNITNIYKEILYNLINAFKTKTKVVLKDDFLLLPLE